jgi:hypothetical protein
MEGEAFFREILSNFLFGSSGNFGDFSGSRPFDCRKVFGRVGEVVFESRRPIWFGSVMSSFDQSRMNDIRNNHYLHFPVFPDDPFS